MKNLFFAAVALLLVAGFAASCSKDQTNTEKLIGTWREVETEIDFGNNGSIDSTETPTACDADNDWVFAAGGTLTVNRNTLCYPTEEATETATWAFNGNETVLTLTYAAFPIPIPLTIEELTSDHLTVSLMDGGDKSTTHFHKQ